MGRYKPFLFAGAIAAVAVCVAAWFAYHRLNNLEWIQRVSGVRLPRGIRNVSVYDQGEMYVTAHVQLPPTAISDFVGTFHFEPTTNASSKLLGMKNLAEQFREFPQNADLIAYNGRSKSQTWNFVLDKRSGNLWVTVQYPDYQGDPP